MKRFFHQSLLKTLLFLGGLPCLAQVPVLPLHVSPGDAGFSTSSVWPSPSMQWGSRFTYTSPPLPAGIYDVLLTFQEPTVTGPKQRIFTVSWLGQSSPPLDLWTESNGTGAVQVAGKIYLSFSGSVVFTFVASVRNAVVSSIDITIPPTPPITGFMVLQGSTDITSNICPSSWIGPRLSDGSCLTIFFSQTPK